MDRKAFVLTSHNGYDYSERTVDTVILGPATACLKTLLEEHQAYFKAERQKIKAQWNELPKAQQKGMTGLAMMYSKALSFPYWLAKQEGFEKIAFEES